MIVDADVRTMNRAAPTADAIAWRDGRIVAVGPRSEVERAAGEGAKLREAKGATVLPGLIDAHHHASIVALYGGVVRLVPPKVTDIESLQRALASAAEELRPGEWLVASDWDEMLLAERRPPTREELDSAVPDRPLMAMHYGCHRVLANSRALELAGIGRHTPDPSGGLISRGKGGVPDGLLIERALCKVEAQARASLIARDAEGFLARLSQHHRAVAASGITHVVDATVPADLVALYREAARRDLFLVPTTLFPVSVTGYLEAPRDVLEGPVTGDEEGPVRIGPVKMVFDGAPGCSMCLSWWQIAGATVSGWALAARLRTADPLRTLLSLEPRLGWKVRTGIAIYQREEAKEIVGRAAERGFAVAIHAIGNEAIDVALGAYEAAGNRLAAAGARRIEHATFLSRELVARIAGLGITIVPQPHFLSLPAFATAASVPGLRNMPLRWLLDAGVKVAGSSDFPVAGFDPLDGIRAAVSRRTARGHLYEEDQRIGLEEALVMYTRGGAEACGILDRAGTLEAGKRADLVLLDGTLDASTLATIKVRETFIGGVSVQAATAGSA
jgi:predicted amidohydrolase YtcJ